jgi:hypothetical protein
MAGHTDSDFSRVARQQDFLRQAKDQVGVMGLIDRRSQLERIFGKAVQTDIRGTTDVLRITNLIAFSLGRGVRQVPFHATAGPSYVTATPEQIRRTVDDFLHPRAPASVRSPRASAGYARRHRHQHGVRPSARVTGLSHATSTEHAGGRAGARRRARPDALPAPEAPTGRPARPRSHVHDPP